MCNTAELSSESRALCVPCKFTLTSELELTCTDQHAGIIGRTVCTKVEQWAKFLAFVWSKPNKQLHQATLIM